MTRSIQPMIKAVAAAALLTSASVVLAQMTPQTADMSVTGTIVPAACSASFAGGSEVDFGTIRLIDLPDNSYYRVGTRDTALQVTCSSAKTVTFSITDTQAGSREANATMAALLNLPSNNVSYMFGLGTASVGGASVNLGGYAIGNHPTLSPTVDGVSRSPLYRNAATTAWGASYGYWAIGGMFTAGAGTTASSGREFVFPMRITAGLNFGSRLQVATDTKLNGQAVFAISYQ